LTVARQDEAERTAGDVTALHLRRKAQGFRIVGVQVDLVAQPDLIFEHAERASLRSREDAARVVIKQAAHVGLEQRVTERARHHPLAEVAGDDGFAVEDGGVADDLLGPVVGAP
jgi:vacuolar-type H+-ATPase subunit F/Vma7